MSFRPEGILEIARITGETATAVAHNSRVMNSADYPYGTTIGSGHRNKHMRAEWLASTYLATIINDPKNAATKVPAFGNLSAWTTRVTRYTNTKYYGLAPIASKTEELNSDPIADSFPNGTVFEIFCGLMNLIAKDPGNDYHRAIRRGFKFRIIQQGRLLSAEMSVLLQRKNQHTETWITTEFHQDPEPPDGDDHRRNRRIIEIPLKHIEALAALYADTLKHEGPATSSPPPSGPASTTAGSENENAALPQAASRRPRKRVLSR